MTWTDEKPKVPGFYWYRNGRFPFLDRIVEVIEFKTSRGKLALVVCFSYDHTKHLSKMRGVSWSGPIPRPEEAVSL